MTGNKENTRPNWNRWTRNSGGRLMILVLAVVVLFTLGGSALFRVTPADNQKSGATGSTTNQENSTHPAATGSSSSSSSGGKTSFADIVVLGSGSYQLELPTGKTDGSNHWSQYGQDSWIDKYLGEKEDGVFVEVGGYDGESHSNSLFFEKIRKWRGLLIEANPFTYNIMRKKDRKVWMVNACVSKDLPEMEFLVAGGITSSSSVASQAHLARIKNDLKTYKSQGNWVGGGEKVNVKCFSLEELLEKTLQTKRIDYFSLDVEGAEMLLLKSIDLNEITIDLFSIEMQEHAEEIREFMTSHGYEEVGKVHIDSIFARKGAKKD